MIKFCRHLVLNPRLWLPDGGLRPKVQEVLTEIYISYMIILAQYVGVAPDIDNDVIDVVLCGSNVGYTYRRKSDLDMNIIIRWDRYLEKMDPDIFEVFVSFVRTYFITEYSPRVFGVNIDMQVLPASTDEPKYSVLHRKWIVSPEMLDESEIKRIQRRANLYYKVMRRKALDILHDKAQHADAAQFVYSLGKIQSNFFNESPFSVAYSEFKQRGYVQKLMNADRAFMRKLMLSYEYNPLQEVYDD